MLVFHQANIFICLNTSTILGLSGGKYMAKCEVCGKDCGEKCIEKSGKSFCTPKHLSQYKAEHEHEEDENVCEFC